MVADGDQVLYFVGTGSEAGTYPYYPGAARVYAHDGVAVFEIFDGDGFDSDGRDHTGVQCLYLANDADRDGVADHRDVCPGTRIPEGVPTRPLGVNRWALVDGDFAFDTNSPKGAKPTRRYTTTGHERVLVRADHRRPGPRVRPPGVRLQHRRDGQLDRPRETVAPQTFVSTATSFPTTRVGRAGCFRDGGRGRRSAPRRDRTRSLAPSVGLPRALSRLIQGYSAAPWSPLLHRVAVSPSRSARPSGATVVRPSASAARSCGARRSGRHRPQLEREPVRPAAGGARGHDPVAGDAGALPRHG